MAVTEEELRAIEADVVEAIRSTLARWRQEPGRVDQAGGLARILAVRAVPRFEYAWPQVVVPYSPAFAIEVDWRGAQYEMRFAQEEGGRPAFGQNRRREVMFVPWGGSLYPVREWTGTDLGEDVIASQIPRPDNPRRNAMEADLPGVRRVPHLADADIRRLDQILPVQAGPSLYVVCHLQEIGEVLVDRGVQAVLEETELQRVISHGMWVAELRGKL